MKDFVSIIDVLPATTLATKPKREDVLPKSYPAIEAAGTTFDAAQWNDATFQNWSHVKPETPEEIIDPLAMERLRSRAVYECLNDDALSGMVNVSAESVVHCGPKLQIRIEIDGERDKPLERIVEREWMQWVEDTRYFIKMRTAVKDLRNYGQYFRRLVYNPRIPNGLDVIYHNPMRVANPDGLENGEFVTIYDERYQVINGVARDCCGNEAFYCVLDRPIYPGPYETWNYTWVDSVNMCRLFDPQLSEQPDGFPWATPSLEKGASRRSYEKSETNAALFSINVPHGYDLFSYTFSYSDYMSPLGNFALYSGDTHWHNIAWNRVLQRNAAGKTTLDVSLSQRTMRRYINDVALTPQRLTSMRIAVNTFRRLAWGQWMAEVSYSQGIGAFNANTDTAGLPDDAAHARFKKVSGLFSLGIPLIKDWLYRSSVSGQYTKTGLYSSEQLYLGGETTVRGFVESPVAGDRGFVWRNDANFGRYSAPFGLSAMFEPYVFLDYGRAMQLVMAEWQQLAGTGVGARFYGKSVRAEASIGWPIKKPDGYRREAQFMTNLNYVF